MLTSDDVRDLLTEVLSTPAGPRSLAGKRSKVMPTQEEVSEATTAFMEGTMRRVDYGFDHDRDRCRHRRRRRRRRAYRSRVSVGSI